MGTPLGQQAFQTATGIRNRDWRGRYWARWSEAVREAGLSPNLKKQAFHDEYVFPKLIDLIRELGRFPTGDELAIRRRKDATFPSPSVWRRMGSTRDQLVARLAAYCEAQANGKESYEDVLSILRPLLASDAAETPEARQSAVPIGFVYLLKSGRHYKLGRTKALGRRERELSIQLPQKTNRVHVIETDDPVGIERYWHSRFADRRVRPDAEWLELTADDVAGSSGAGLCEFRQSQRLRSSREA
ncbi:MAG TPA: GIY-YIG nuclease family protein [Actinomycetota bacterium]|nr:GIY-YIG nuclease family protein [Actinomycetota bacterium]